MRIGHWSNPNRRRRPPDCAVDCQEVRLYRCTGLLEFVSESASVVRIGALVGERIGSPPDRAERRAIHSDIAADTSSTGSCRYDARSLVGSAGAYDLPTEVNPRNVRERLCCRLILGFTCTRGSEYGAGKNRVWVIGGYAT